MTKLNDMQCILLSNAAQREDGSLLPPPDSLSMAPGRIAQAITSLLRLKFAVERKTAQAETAWREEDEERFAAVITDTGRSAIGIETGSMESEATSAEEGPSEEAVSNAPTKTKCALVLDLLRRSEGASLAELVAATGWLPHTMRAALTGLRKKGHAIERSKRAETTVYQIASAD